jgi:hypothetical protein
MKGKDLINIGIFSAIYFVIVFIIAMLGMIPIFLPLLSVLVPITTVRENCDDILADAKEINEQRALKEEADLIADTAEETADTSEE